MGKRINIMNLVMSHIIDVEMLLYVPLYNVRCVRIVEFG
jgi:hypothetical protein